jgi:hypothetical protein
VYLWLVVLPPTRELPPVDFLEGETFSLFPLPKSPPAAVRVWARQKMEHNRGFEPTREHGYESMSAREIYQYKERKLSCRIWHYCQLVSAKISSDL